MKKFRTRVFNQAHEIKKATGKTFAVSLSKAWALYRLSKKMRTTEKVVFAYEKKDGTLRRAYGTLKNVGQFIKGTGTSSCKVFQYWDLQANGFRSFNVQSLITIY